MSSRLAIPAGIEQNGAKLSSNMTGKHGVVCTPPRVIRIQLDCSMETPLPTLPLPVVRVDGSERVVGLS